MAKGEKTELPQSTKEMSVDELKRELKKVVKQINELEKLEDDPELKELFELAIGNSFGLDEVLVLVAFTKMMFLFARYFDLPPELLAFKQKESSQGDEDDQ